MVVIELHVSALRLTKSAVVGTRTDVVPDIVLVLVTTHVVQLHTVLRSLNQLTLGLRVCTNTNILAVLVGVVRVPGTLVLAGT